jgi:GT2 family glycosyltransferase
MTARGVDVVIASYNAREELRACLSALARHPPARPHTVIVVDNASQDGSREVIPEVLPPATLIALDENVGFARATNVGIRAGRAPLVLLLNSDTLVPSGAIDGLVAALEAAPEAAAAGPRLVDAEGRAELSFGRMMTPWSELRQKCLVTLQRRGWQRPVDRMTRRTRTVDWVSGACLLVWRAEAEAVGLLDERYFMYAEDVDFCAALRSRGRRILFTPAAEIVHLRGRSWQRAPAATRLGYRRSQIAFYAKHHPSLVPLLKWYLRIRGEHP